MLCPGGSGHHGGVDVLQDVGDVSMERDAFGHEPLCPGTVQVDDGGDLHARQSLQFTDVGPGNASAADDSDPELLHLISLVLAYGLCHEWFASTLPRQGGVVGQARRAIVQSCARTCQNLMVAAFARPWIATLRWSAHPAPGCPLAS